MLLDRHQRPLRNLRLSVTDRCNLRCSYCMPEAEYAWLPREDILDFEELERLVGVFVSLGVPLTRQASSPSRRVRLQVTGREAVIEALAEDISTSGATTRTSPKRLATSASAAMPGLYTPSSLVTRMRIFSRAARGVRGSP